MKHIRRLRLRRGDGDVYLDRWGWACRWFGIYLHRMTAPDPGVDLHDHPWPFVSIVLRGGYTEERAPARDAPWWAAMAAAWPDRARRGVEMSWRAGSVHRVRADECHRIITLRRTPTWTVCLIGRRFRSWGFYTPAASGGFRHHAGYSAGRRDLYAEDIGS